MDKEQILKDVYALVAELWCNPLDSVVHSGGVQKSAEEVVKDLESIDKESAALLSSFLGQHAISEEDYIDLFELDPQCPLYLGSHTYDEPKTCANSAVSDRNGYMIELAGIYSHFGQTLQSWRTFLVRHKYDCQDKAGIEDPIQINQYNLLRK